MINKTVFRAEEDVMARMDEIIAHKTENEEQSLIEHSKNVSILAEEFANSFGNGDWAQFAGMFHDLGKAFSNWQKYIRGLNSTSINHSEVGAQYAFSRMNSKDPCAKVIPYLIAGHHAGLPDYDIGSGNELKKILKGTSYELLINNSNLQEMLDTAFPKTIPFGKNDIKKDNPQKLLEYFHLWIRMLYSCLVDADFLDTENFMTPAQAELRGNKTSLSDLKKKFDSYMTEIAENASPSKINDIRSTILKACCEKGALKPGFYSLNVPTGGGKTLSSMAFALEHALAHDKKRIIMVIPYTSIIEQTAKIYKYGTDNDEEIRQSGKCLFGEENVLEHHCNFNFEQDERYNILKKQKLAVENWDVPIVVTTNVQLFESLFAARSSSCRKLHNIVDSVIILDEAQMLPPEYLKSILSVLQGLVKCFGVTVVLCTATQPALEGTIGSDRYMFEGLPQDCVTPIIENPQELAEQLKRVEINSDFVKNKILDWETLADKLCEYEQVLCIVQTRKDCRELHSLMPEGTIHLSALMCAAERSDVISDIKEKLKNGEAIRVISTQLVECGVDIDFPVVFRAMAGMDSVAQSAGRCNREGKLQSGTVFLFESPTKTPPGLLGKGAEVTRDLLEEYQFELKLTPDLYKKYFTAYYKKIDGFDRKYIFKETMLDGAMEGKFQFRTLSEKYHLINNGFQGTIYVRYCSPKTGKDNIDLLQRLFAADVDNKLFKQLVRYGVNLPLKEIQELFKAGRIVQPIEGIFMQSLDDDNLYQAGLGLVTDSIQSFSTYVF